MNWSSGRRNGRPKRRPSDSDSHSDEEKPFVSDFLKNCSLQNRPCKHSNCSNNFASSSGLKNKSQVGEAIPNNSASCSNITSNGCTPFCNPKSIGGNNASQVPLGAKRSNLTNGAGNISNSERMRKSLNFTPTNAHSSRGNYSPSNSAMNGALPNVTSSSAEGASNSLRGVVMENSIANNVCPILNQINDSQRSTPESATSQESTSARVNNLELNVSSQMKLEKVSNLQQQNSGSSLPGNSGPLYNWQATMTTVKERFAFLFNNEVLSDVHFRVGKGDSCQRIPAHKFVLAVGSAVFDAMFYGKLCTRQEEIELPDVEPQAFLSLLQFLYSDEVQIGPETVMTVLYTAKKYAVPALERHCVEYLKCNLSPDNAFMLLTQARLFDEPQLAALCLDTIDKNTNDALMADGFTDIDHSTLCMVLERDTLRIREVKLFQAVVRWSEAKCLMDSVPVTGPTQRTLLAEALSLVRFPLMTIEEFAQGPAQSGVLTDKEIVQLFLYFTVNPKPPVNFLDIPRCCMTGKEQTVCRFQQVESRWGYSGTSDRIRFIVDRRIFVVGFGMYGSIHGPSEYEVTIQIIHTGTGKVCISNDTNFVSDGSVNTFRVMFKEPFEVLPNTNYTAYATLKGPDSHYGTKGVRKISVVCLSGDRVTFQFTYAAGDNNGTSVEDGQIPEIIFYT